MRPLVVLLTAVFLVPALLPVEAQSPSGAIRVALRGMAADFVPERYKEDAPLFGDLGKGTPVPILPVGYTGVYRNPYYDGAARFTAAGPPGVANAWGHHLNLTLDLVQPGGGAITDPPANLFIEAKLQTSAGDIPARLVKAAATRFVATFDLDGERGKPWPALLGGTVTAVVDVFEQLPASSQPRKLGTDTLAIRTTYAVAGLPAFPFPPSAIPVYSDLGNLTPLHAPAARPEPLEVGFSFGTPNALARIVAVNNRALTVVAEGRTDANGVLRGQADIPTILGTAAGGLLVLEGHLLGDVATATVGNGLVVVPVSSHGTVVTGIARETRAPTQDPAGTVLVTVHDPDGTPQSGARYGNLVVLNGMEILANVPFQPAEPGAPSVNHRHARFLARMVEEKALASYNLYAFLFGNPGEFYSLSTATRGYTLSLAPVGVGQGEPAELRIAVRNLNSNGDARQDVGLALTTRLSVTGLPGGANWTGEVSLAEGASDLVSVPLATSEAGRWAVTVNSTADELRVDRTAAVEVAAPRGAIDGILGRLTPGPGVLLLAVFASLAALVAGRRRA